MPIALLFGLVAMAILMPTLFYAAQQNQQVILSSAAAQQLAEITSAASNYAQANYQLLVGSTSPTSPTTISLSTLITDGYLPPGFGSTNPYGQSWQVQALQPSTGQLQLLVASTGGSAIDGKDAARIASQSGAQGGVVGGGTGALSVPGCAANQACGAYGGWSVNTTNYTGITPGHVTALLAFNSAGALNQDYLYRVAITGQPQLNQMQTNLDMGGNNVNNAQTVNANGNITAGPAGTAQTGACTLDADGHCMGQIQAAGQSEANLPSGWWGGVISRDVYGSGTIAAGTGGNVAASMNSSGQIQGNTVNANQSVTVGGGGAFSADSTGFVKASLAVLPGNTAVNGGACSVAPGAISATPSGQLMSCQGGIWLPAGVTIGVVGQPCGTQGGVGQDTSGNGLICQSGSLEPIQARMGGMVGMGSFLVQNGTIVTKPTCLSGGADKIVVTPGGWQINNPGSWSFKATDQGGSWQVNMVDGYGNPLVGYAIAQTYCQYN